MCCHENAFTKTTFVKEISFVLTEISDYSLILIIGVIINMLFICEIFLIQKVRNMYKILKLNFPPVMELHCFCYNLTSLDTPQRIYFVAHTHFGCNSAASK